MTTASRLGLPDIAFASLNDFAENGHMIANLDTSVPLIADMDTGFGGPNAIARSVQMYDRVGIAGFHIEDQIFVTHVQLTVRIVITNKKQFFYE